MSDGTSSQRVLRLLANVNIASELCSAALVDEVGLDLGLADNGGILLAGVYGRAVASNLGVNYEKWVSGIGFACGEVAPTYL